MLHDTLDKIDQILQKGTLSETQKQQLTELNQQLKVELTELAATNPEQANSIAGFAKIATYEAIRDDKNDDLIGLAQEGMHKTVESMEVSHPKLCGLVQTICTHLASIGI